MAARVVVVHDEPDFVGQLALALRLNGYDVDAFTSPISDWEVIASLQHAEVLITRMEYPPGLSDGVIVALRVGNYPDIHLLVPATLQRTERTDRAGAFLRVVPTIVASVVETVERLLDSAGLRPDRPARTGGLSSARLAQPVIPKLEPEVERILAQRRCATCRYWGKHRRGVVKLLADRIVTARRCGIDASVTTFPDDGCKSWRQS